MSGEDQKRQMTEMMTCSWSSYEKNAQRQLNYEQVTRNGFTEYVDRDRPSRI